MTRPPVHCFHNGMPQPRRRFRWTLRVCRHCHAVLALIPSFSTEDVRWYWKEVGRNG